VQVDIVKSYPASEVAEAPRVIGPETQIGKLIHSAFTGLIRSDSFPCIGARAAWARSSYFIGVYDEIATESTTLDLGRLLREFVTERAQGKLRNDFSTLIAIFIQPSATHEAEFETVLWDQLQRLHNMDDEGWSPDTSADPLDERFGFSYFESAFFIVGLHPGASRWARRFPYAAITFNLHEQFEQLRAQGIFERFRDTIRARDIKLQGQINPVLTDFGDASEARQYSGRHVEQDWICPFAPKGADG